MIEHSGSQRNEAPAWMVGTEPSGRRRFPWRGVVAGAVAAGAVVAAVQPFDSEAAQWGPFLLSPVLVLGWAVTAALTLVVVDGREVMGVVTLSVIPGAGWLLDLPHDAGSTEWNVAVLVASSGGVALTEWVLTEPRPIRIVVAVIIFIAGVWMVDVVGDEYMQRRSEAIIADTPAPYTVDVVGWSAVDVTRFPQARSSLVELRTRAGIVSVEASKRLTDAREACRGDGDKCRPLAGGVWMSRAGEQVSLHRVDDGIVVSMDYERRTTDLPLALEAMDTLRPLTEAELERLGEG